MASTKSRSGISKCGTNRTLISGRAIPKEQPTINFTIVTAQALKKRESRAARRRAGHGSGRLGRPVHSPLRSTNHIPVDFVSTHVYGNDSAKDVFGTERKRFRARKWFAAPCTKFTIR